jgi:ATP-dependent helicase HrpA
VNELINAGLRHACFEDGAEKIRSQTQFEKALDQGGKNWVSSSLELETSLLAAIKHRDKILKTISSINAGTVSLDQALEDIKSQIYRLLEPKILRYTSLTKLKQYPRYLRAIESRLEKMKFASKTVSEEMALSELQKNLLIKVDQLSTPELGVDYVYLNYPALTEFSLMLEEWRVSIFAQHLRTQTPVSEKRLRKFWKDEVEELQ